jgi:uncharacterized lipoprotein YajG
MRNLLIAVLAVGVLAGCGANRSETTFYKPGVSTAQMDADRRECLIQSVGAIENKIATFSQMLNREAWEECMRARGYSVDAASASISR